ncbi:DUF799 domain-containing protein [Desulfogranum japonicum]|uniref:DUF799 domain-containing protein n=1 Tax=Desulfogranum japonicum TaxID=231447 RepID=UPI0003FF3FBD|nr:GNA1162 family protein [Desulfogranum japonicum]
MRKITGLFLSTVFILSGCATPGPPPDYTAFRERHPRSILVLPPLNESTDLKASYSVLSTVSKPLAEMGYYVFPVAVIDQFLKENGMPTPGEMHQIPLDKVDEIIGADSILYLVVNEYGTKYTVVNSAAVVQVTARLVDVKTGERIWSGQVKLWDDASGGSGDLVAMLINSAINQVISQSTDQSHYVAEDVSSCLFMTCPSERLLYGPYHPAYGTD